MTPKDCLSLVGVGSAYESLGDFDDAIANFTQAIRLQPNDARIYDARAHAYCAKGEFDKAIADCNEAIRIMPQFARAYFARATIYTRKGDEARAVEDFAQAKKLGYKQRPSPPSSDRLAPTPGTAPNAKQK